MISTEVSYIIQQICLTPLIHVETYLNIRKFLISLTQNPRIFSYVKWFLWVILLQNITELWNIYVDVIIKMTEPLISMETEGILIPML